MASDVIYFTVLIFICLLSYFPLSPYLFMMFAVIGTSLSVRVVEILNSLFCLASLQQPPPSKFTQNKYVHVWVSVKVRTFY